MPKKRLRGRARLQPRQKAGKRFTQRRKRCRDEETSISPTGDTASPDIRYALPETAFRKAILDAIKRLNIKGISNVNVQPFRGKHT